MIIAVIVFLQEKLTIDSGADQRDQNPSRTFNCPTNFHDDLTFPRNDLEIYIFRHRGRQILCVCKRSAVRPRTTRPPVPILFSARSSPSFVPLHLPQGWLGDIGGTVF